MDKSEQTQLLAKLDAACHQIRFIRDLILRHMDEQTADVRQVCSNMDAIIWAWAEDREGDLAPFLKDNEQSRNKSGPTVDDSKA